MITKKYLYLSISFFIFSLWSVFFFHSTQTPITETHLAAKTVRATPVVPVPNAAPIVTEAQGFQKLTQETLSVLVKNSDIVVHSYEDIHDNPKETFKNSEAFGAIMDSLKANPDLAPQAMDFYEKCANSEETLISTRAVCLSHLMYWGSRTKSPINTARYSEDLVRIAKNLPIVW